MNRREFISITAATAAGLLATGGHSLANPASDKSVTMQTIGLAEKRLDVFQEQLTALMIHGPAYARVQRPGGRWVSVHHRPQGPAIAVVRNYAWTQGMETIDDPLGHPPFPEDYP